jgi:hypothetical protein
MAGTSAGCLEDVFEDFRVSTMTRPLNLDRRFDLVFSSSKLLLRVVLRVG